MGNMIEFDLKEVERLAGLGLSQEQVAQNLGISERTIRNRLSDDAAFAEAYKRGQAKGIQTIANALFQNATGGNVTAQIFFLKARAQWKDKHEGGPEDDSEVPQSVPVTVQDASK